MNDSYGLTAENILRTLPEVLKADESMLAIGTAVADALASFPGEIDRLRIYPRVAELDEGLLDILAYDFKVDWWDPDYTSEQKRQTLKESWAVRRTLGTKHAVIWAISAIYSDTRVEEWFEYGAPPYHWKLIINATYERVDLVKHRRVLDRLEYYKNLRSVPYTVEYAVFPGGKCTGYAAAAAMGVDMEITAGVSVYGLE